MVTKKVLAAQLKKSGIRRDEVFVTTKLWNSDHGYENTKKQLILAGMKEG